MKLIKNMALTVVGLGMFLVSLAEYACVNVLKGKERPVKQEPKVP